jgi:aspartate racemase
MTGAIGVIGGMGPLATADFFAKVIECTPADNDEGHVPLLISSDPRIPRRPAAILEGGPTPLPALLAVRDRLLAAGACALVMPCNTAHHWHAELARDARVPFPSIVECSADGARERVGTGGSVAVVATRATLAAHLFEPALAARRLRALLPDDTLLDALILPAIAAVKAGRLADARAGMQQAARVLVERGADAVLLACTEAPIAMQGADAALQARCIDTTLELARATVRLWREIERPTSS